MDSRGITILLIICIFTASSAEVENPKSVHPPPVSKCCASDEILSNETIACIKNTDKEYTSFYGHNVQIGSGALPTCKDGVALNTTDIKPSTTVSEKSCVDIMTNQEQVNVYCDDEKSKPNVEGLASVQEIFKCCNQGESYNIHTRACIAQPHNDAISEYFPNDSFVFFHVIPWCKDDDVLMEYHSIDYNITLNNGTLVLKSHSKTITVEYKKYCIEQTTNDDSRLLNNQEKSVPINSSKMIAKVCQPRDICDKIPCIPKCCRDGERYNEDYDCVESSIGLTPILHSLANKEKIVSDDNRDIGILHSLNCTSAVMLKPNDYRYDKHVFDNQKGHLIYLNKRYKEMEVHGNYCVEYIGENATEFSTMVCGFVKYDTDQFVQGIFCFISAFFVIITFLIYIILPRLRDIHGKILICYLISLFCGYLSLAVIKLFSNKIEDCRHLSYFFYFSFIASFSWLTIKSFDIYYTIRSMQQCTLMSTSMNKRFLYYSCFGWSVPIVLTGFTKLVDTYEWTSYEYLPKLGKPGIGCGFSEGGTGQIIYFTVPIGIMIISNTFMFVRTATHFNNVNTAVKHTRTSTCSKGFAGMAERKAVFLINIKLFTVMGVPWTFEVLSAFFPDSPKVWIFTDYLNTMQGIFIFLVFAIHRKVILAVRNYLGISDTNSTSNEGTVRTTCKISKQEMMELKQMRGPEEDPNEGN